MDITPEIDSDVAVSPVDIAPEIDSHAAVRAVVIAWEIDDKKIVGRANPSRYFALCL